MQQTLDTPWKVWNEALRWFVYPRVRFIFAANGIPWGKGWRMHGVPILQRHRRSLMKFGNRMGLRSSSSSNPLGPNHPVVLCTWQAGALLQIGDDFGMTGGSICAAEQIVIGDRVVIGANTTLVDTDFHPLEPEFRRRDPQSAKTVPIRIEDDVFIGMNCLILKGVRIGCGSVIGAGSVVSRDVPPGAIAAGNPAKVIRENQG